jgi:hypothetical protein
MYDIGKGEAMIDPNVESVREKMRQRAEVGFAKYGCTTERSDIDIVGWITHLQEELMDASIYCQKLLMEIKKWDTNSKI